MVWFKQHNFEQAYGCLSPLNRKDTTIFHSGSFPAYSQPQWACVRGVLLMVSFSARHRSCGILWLLCLLFKLVRPFLLQLLAAQYQAATPWTQPCSWPWERQRIGLGGGSKKVSNACSIIATQSTGLSRDAIDSLKSSAALPPFSSPSPYPGKAKEDEHSRPGIFAVDHMGMA